MGNYVDCINQALNLPPTHLASHTETEQRAEKVERKLRIAVQECYSYRIRMEAAIKKAEGVASELDAAHRVAKSMEERAVAAEKELEQFKRMHGIYQANGEDDSNRAGFKVSARALSYWMLLKNSVRISGLVNSGAISNSWDEKAFLAMLTMHSGSKQKLLFRYLFSTLSQYRSLLKISNTMALETNFKTALKTVCTFTFFLLI